MENDAVGKKVERVVQQVDAVGDAAEPAEKPPARDGCYPRFRLRDHDQQESAIKKGKPGVADGDGDYVDRMHQPPEQRADAQEEDKQAALQQRSMLANELANSRMAPTRGQNHAARERIGAARHQVDAKIGSGSPIAEQHEPQEGRQNYGGSERNDETTQRKKPDQ